MQQKQELKSEQGNVIHMGNKIVVIVDDHSFSFNRIYNELDLRVADGTFCGDLEKTHRTLIQRLAEYLPDFFNPDVIRLSEHQCPNLCAKIHYKIHQNLSHVEAEVKVRSNLLENDIYSNTILLLMHQHTELQKYRPQLEGKKGVVISGDCYLGDDRNKDTHLWFSDAIDVDGLNSLLNILCDGRKVTKDEVMKELDIVYFEPFRHIKAYGAFAHMSDMTLRGIKAADQPVGEFMQWLKKNKFGVQTVGGLLGEARIKYKQAKEYQGMVDAKQVDKSFQHMAEQTGDNYLSMANEMIERFNLKPPVNNRMVYLVR